jgi:DHA2 family multidrug resistance protein-like MFS transporter
MESHLQQHNKILFALCLPMFIACIDIMALSLALKIILDQFHTTVAEAQWLFTAYMIGTAAFLIPIGKLADSYGRVKILNYGIWIFAVASIIAGFAMNMPMLILGRFMQGLAGAIMMTASLSIITHNYPREHRGHAIAIWGMAMGLGLALGPLLGGAILNFGLSWRFIFLINLPVCLIVSYLVMRYVPDSKASKIEIISWLEVIVLIAILFLIVLILADGSSFGWLSNMMLLSYVALIVFASVLMYLLRNSKNPIIDVSLFKVKHFTPAVMCGSISYFCSYAWLFIFSLYLQKNLNFTALHSGLLIAAYSFSFAVNAMLTSMLMRRYGNKSVMQLGFVIMVASLVGMLFIDRYPSNILITVLFALFAMGVTYVNAPSITATAANVPTEKSGLVSGLMFTIRWVGGLIGVALITEVYNYVSTNSHAILPATCMVMASFAFLGWIVTTFFLQHDAAYAANKIN